MYSLIIIIIAKLEINYHCIHEIEEEYMKEQTVKFNGYSITRMEMLKIEKFDKKQSGELNIETECYENSEDSKIHKLVMKLSTTSNKHRIHLDVEGYFEFDGDFDTSDIEIFLRVNASSILYPYCRTIISTITGLDSQNIILPIINFANLK